MLRRAVANLARPAEEQATYLDDLLAPVSGPGGAAAYGNDELALHFEDYFSSADHMLEAGEITLAEVAAAAPLDEMLREWSGQSNADFWTREALFTDQRWDQVRLCAQNALPVFPDEVREGKPDVAR